MAGLFLFSLSACDASGGKEQESEELGQLTVALTDALPSSVVSPYVGLAWTPAGSQEGFPRFLTEAVSLDGNQAEVQFSVFQGPPAGAVLERDGLRIAFGMILAFDDRDGDGDFVVSLDGIEPPDLLFGLSMTDLLLYMEVAPGARFPEELFSNPEAFSPGLSRVRIDPCTGQLELLPLSAPLALEFFDPSSGIEDLVPPICEEFEECKEEECLDLYEAYEDCFDTHGEEACFEEANAYGQCMIACIDGPIPT